MAILRTVYVIHTTRDEEDANTEAEFQLHIVVPGSELGSVQLDFPDVAGNERERGRTDRYRFHVNGLGVDSEHRMYMRMVTTDDGWHPESIWVIGVTTDGKSHLLSSHENWLPWFDRPGRTTSPMGPAMHRIR
ncbi:hypothetical protein [Nocardia sp. NPDC047038]|uniref:hypothetical protein n=1 Tax=Nocardia sp. NPDC047038 TaxID=3154338 RepID=UPI0033F39812